MFKILIPETLHCIEHKVYDKAEKELNDFIEFFSAPKDYYIELDKMLKKEV